MTVIDILLWCLVAAVFGALAMWLWMRKELVHYKHLYVKVRNEKMNLMNDYNNRLDSLGRTLGTDASYLKFSSTDIAMSEEYDPAVDDIYE